MCDRSLVWSRTSAFQAVDPGPNPGDRTITLFPFPKGKPVLKGKGVWASFWVDCWVSTMVWAFSIPDGTVLMGVWDGPDGHRDGPRRRSLRKSFTPLPAACARFLTSSATSSRRVSALIPGLGTFDHLEAGATDAFFLNCGPAVRAG